MALSVALPGAALRVTRTAVGRRALQVVLLAGGLFALGLLFGEQAHAADGMAPTTPVPAVQSVTGAVTRPVIGAVTRSVEQSLERPVAHVVKSAGRSVLEVGSVPSSAVTNVTHITDSVQTQVTEPVLAPVTDTVRHVVQPVGELVVQPVVDDVVLPIGDLVETVTGGLTGTPAEILPALPELPPCLACRCFRVWAARFRPPPVPRRSSRPGRCRRRGGRGCCGEADGPRGHVGLRARPYSRAGRRR